jgi:hypothetical protein
VTVTLKEERPVNDYLTPDRLLAAQFVTAMSTLQYEGYPDPSTPSGWAEVPAVMLLVDFSGREDIVYAAMVEAESLLADDAGLAITAADNNGTCLYLFGITFEGQQPLDIAGVASPEAIRMFADAEMLLIASADQEHDGGAPILAFAPNDPSRWIDRLLATGS